MRLWINDNVLENRLPSEAVTDNINKAMLSNSSGQTVTTLMRFGIRRDLQYQMDSIYLTIYFFRTVRKNTLKTTNCNKTPF